MLFSLFLLMAIGGIQCSEILFTKNAEETGIALMRLLREFSVNESQNINKLGNDTSEAHLPVNAMWWNGPNVCTHKHATLELNSFPKKGGRATQALERSAFSMCRVESHARICRTVKTLNATATEDTMTTYACCDGFRLTGNICLDKSSKIQAKDSIGSSLRKKDHSSQNTTHEELGITKVFAELKDIQTFSGVLQNLLESTLGSAHSIFMNILNTQNPDNSEEDSEDDETDDLQQFKKPVANNSMLKSTTASLSRLPVNVTLKQNTQKRRSR